MRTRLPAQPVTEAPDEQTCHTARGAVRIGKELGQGRRVGEVVDADDPPEAGAGVAMMVRVGYLPGANVVAEQQRGDQLGEGRSRAGRARLSAYVPVVPDRRAHGRCAEVRLVGGDPTSPPRLSPVVLSAASGRVDGEMVADTE
ncbi:hypothetical protein ACIOJE_18270 [Kitasatospora sp. NPDC087861]|uniref:hypothetical protein n=1 Tax=Kitasatospora sp. NPDC087861 TaxID=3364070 RepID=UPI0038089AD9